jgi:hypothetical protein
MIRQRNRGFYLARLVGLGCIAMVVAFAFAQMTPEAVYKVTATTLDGPEQLEAGFHTFTTQSDGVNGYTINLFRLKEGATLEAFEPAFETVDKAFNGEGDVSVALNAALELADVVIENGTEPGELQASAGVTLEEGHYVLAYSQDVENGPSTSYYKPLEVVASDAPAVAPEADVTVQFVDFAFALPPDIKTGEHMWEVVNHGKELHHMVVFKLKEGKTLEEFQTFMDSEEGEPPFEETGGAYFGILSPERSAYKTMNLAPGNYIAICYMPDHAVGGDGAPHFTHGMVQAFTVASE